MAERTEDARLLAALAEALGRDIPTPPPEGLAALHAAVDRRAMGELAPEPGRRLGWTRPRSGALGWRRPAGVVAIVAGSVVAGGGVAFASGASVPPPIRELATHLGLPVTPQPVVNVHNTESSLSKALKQDSNGNAGTTGTANSVISHYAGTLRRQVSQLTPAQKQDEEPPAQHLLDQAARQDDQGQNGSVDKDHHGNAQGGSGQNRNNGDGHQGNRSDSQHGSTGGNHSGSSRSGGNNSQQGSGDNSDVRVGTRFSTTTSVLRHRGHRNEG